MKPKHTLYLPLLLSLLLVTAGCSMAPKYQRPEAPVADSWPQGDAYNTLKTKPEQEPEVAAIPWKEFFVDEKLDKVIGMTLENNRDLRVAILTMEKMQAMYRIRRSDQFPSIQGAAGASSQRISESLSYSGQSMISRQHSLNVGISAYELDFFGRVKSLKEAALDQYLATEQARYSTQISLISQVSGAWLTLSADKEKLKLAKDTFQAQKDSYDMIKRRYDLGASSELDLRQAQTRVEAARLDMARYTGIVAQDRNMLDLLAGAPVPQDLLPDALGSMDSENTILGDLAPGLPSNVLLNRPDVLSAESNLLAMNASIGAARAAFFPRITLTGSFGVATRELDNLFDEGHVWSFAPQISIPIFTWGKNKANLEAAEIDRDIAVANYEKAIQTAFREVSDALAQNGVVDDQLTAQKALLEATAETYRLSDVRYKKGIDSFLTVLDAQRSMYSAQQAMIDVRLLKLTSRVTLFKVLGGGGF